MRSRLATAALALAAGSVLLVGCSDDGDEASTCSDMQTLAADVRGLSDVDVISSGLDALDEQLEEIESAAETAKASGEEQFGDQLDALSGAVSTLKEAVAGALDSGDSPSELAEALGSDVAAVSTAWDDLDAAVDAEMGDCDLSADS